MKNTAISINIVGSKLQAYTARPKGSVGIQWNLHISVGASEDYKFLFSSVKPEHGMECVCCDESFHSFPFTITQFYKVLIGIVA